MRRKTKTSSLIVIVGAALALTSYAMSSASNGALTSSVSSLLPASFKPPPGSPNCNSGPAWATGILGELYRLLIGCPPCDDRNACTKDGVKSGACVYTPKDGARCDDGNACTRSDTCDGSVCQGKAVECTSSAQCKAASCNPRTGRCETKPTSGTSCSDGNPCTFGDVCSNGVCKTGPAVDCSSDNPCQVGSCSEATGGCSFESVADGTSCDDGNVCDGSGTCQGGHCTPSGTGTFAISGTAPAPLLVQPAADGGSYIAANVVGSLQVAGQNIRADEDGDILVTEFTREGRPVFSTLISGPGKQEALSVEVDRNTGDLRLFLQTDQTFGLEFGVQRCGLDGDTLFCAEVPNPDECFFQTPDGVIPCGFCGNGVADHPDEQCDDGNDIQTDECTNTCLIQCLCNGVPCDCDTGGVLDPIDFSPLDPIVPIGNAVDPGGPGAPVSAASAPSTFAVTAAAVAAPQCVIPGSPTVPGNAQVTIARTTGVVTLVLVYPTLGTGSAWRSVTQPATETHYVYGFTQNDTAVSETPPGPDINIDLIAGSFSLAGKTGCVKFDDLTADPTTVLSQWGAGTNELADRAILSGGKLYTFSSFVSPFELGGVPLNLPATGCAPTASGYVATAVAAVTANLRAVPPQFVVGSPAPLVTCLLPPVLPAAARTFSPLAPGAEALGAAPLAAVAGDVPTSSPFSSTVTLATSHGLWWGGGMPGALAFSTPEGDQELAAPGEGLDAFLVLINEAGGVEPMFTSGAPGDEVVRALAADRNEDIVIAGNFDARVDLGDQRFISRGGRDIFLVKLTPSGQITFRGTFGGPGDDSAESLTVSPDDNSVHLTVLTAGGIDFGTGPLPKGSHLVHLGAPSNAPSCAVDEPCQVGSCDPEKGCVVSNAADGSACRDGAVAGQCKAGICFAQP